MPLAWQRLSLRLTGRARHLATLSSAPLGSLSRASTRDVRHSEAVRVGLARSSPLIACLVWKGRHLIPQQAAAQQRAVATMAATNQGVDITGNTIPPPPPQKVKVALCQLLVGDDKSANIKLAQEAVADAASNGAQLVVLPEMWNCPYSNASFPVYAEPLGEDGRAGESGRAMSEAAAKHGVTLVGGSVPERTADGKLYNTCCVYERDGSLLATHRKVHLFDIDIPGKMTFFESETLSPGEALTVVDTQAGRLGIGICYDIRFPEMALIYAARGVQLLLYPGAFNMVTGPAHWELLLRARAVDSQLFVAGCGPARNPPSGFTAWGHSTVVGPFAEILAAAEEGPATVYAHLDYSQIPERRTNMPFQQQKRPDLYGVLDKTRTQ